MKRTGKSTRLVSVLGPAATSAGASRSFAMNSAEDMLPSAMRAVGEGLVPLYRLFVEDYAPRLRGYGEAALADGFTEWRRRLE